MLCIFYMMYNLPPLRPSFFLRPSSVLPFRLTASFVSGWAESLPLLQPLDTFQKAIATNRNMSKQSLQKAAHERSGVSYEESNEVLSMEPSIYERVGGQAGLRELSTLFYDKVFDDKEADWFVNIFSSSTRAEAIENQYLFLVQTLGGPALYREKKGKYTRLVGRHANYAIGQQAAERWLHHMRKSLEEHSILGRDDQARKLLEQYFTYTAHYIVVAMDYMRPDQVGHVWWNTMTDVLQYSVSIRMITVPLSYPLVSCCS